jgi:hypothetical protein
MSDDSRRRCLALAIGIGLLILAPPPAAAAEALDRLFFTAERRAQLDRQREMNLLDKQPAQSDPTLTIDGIVSRSSGKRTAWINGQPQHESDLGSSLTVSTRRGDPGQVLLEANDSPTARARVGETVNRSTGT